MVTRENKSGRLARKTERLFAGLANYIEKKGIDWQSMSKDELIRLSNTIAKSTGLEGITKTRTNYLVDYNYDEFVKILKGVDIIPIFDKKTEVKVEPQITKVLVKTIRYYSDGTYQESFEDKKENVTILDPFEFVEKSAPVYTMFAEVEDGFMILRGTYKGHMIDDIDGVAGFPAKAGWASYMLKQDKNLTDDDRKVFNKIIDGKL